MQEAAPAVTRSSPRLQLSSARTCTSARFPFTLPAGAGSLLQQLSGQRLHRRSCWPGLPVGPHKSRMGLHVGAEDWQWGWASACNISADAMRPVAAIARSLTLGLSGNERWLTQPAPKRRPGLRRL